jgi:hypothetical protein
MQASLRNTGKRVGAMHGHQAKPNRQHVGMNFAWQHKGHGLPESPFGMCSRANAALTADMSGSL